MEDILNSNINSSEFTSIPLSCHEVRAKIIELEKETIFAIQCGDSKTKNHIIEEIQAMLREIRSIPASNSCPSKLQCWKCCDFSNFINNATCYLFHFVDHYPLILPIVFVYVSLLTLMELIEEHFNFTVNECNTTYQLTRWGLLMVSLLYLTVMGYMTSSADSIKVFIQRFWKNWIVFILLVMVTVTFPPLKCYLKTSGIVMLMGFGLVGLIAMGSVTRIRKCVSKMMMERNSDEISRAGYDSANNNNNLKHETALESMWDETHNLNPLHWSSSKVLGTEYKE